MVLPLCVCYVYLIDLSLYTLRIYFTLQHFISINYDLNHTDDLNHTVDINYYAFVSCITTL